MITFSGFDGQVTDVQVWDYPLRYREVTDYMNPSAYKYEPIPVCVCECVFICEDRFLFQTIIVRTFFV